MQTTGESLSSKPTMLLVWRQLALSCALLLFAGSCLGQTPTSDGQGFTPYSTFQGGDIDSINLSTGNVVIKIPLLSYPQRGGKLRLAFNFYDTNKNWWVYNNGKVATWTFANNGTSNPFLPGGPYIWPDQSIRGQNSNYDWTDSYKKLHLVFQEHAITADSATHAVQIADPVEAGPGWTADGTAIWYNGNDTSPTFIDSNGIEYTAGSATNLPGNVIDPNGNEITYGTSGWTDTLGRQIPGYPTSGTMTTAPGVAGSTTNCPSGTVSALQWTVPAPSGGTAAYYFCYANFSYQTDFGYSGVNDVSGTNLMISAIVLPDSTSWIFNYDSYLSISSITLPTGGTITYTWTTINVAPPFRAISSRTINANDGTGAHTWNYNWTGTGTENLTLTDPLGNNTLVSSPTGYVATMQIYTGSGTLLKTVANSYTAGAEDQIGCCGGSGGLINIFPTTSTVTWANGSVMQTATSQFDPGFTYGWFQPNGGVGTVINRTAVYGLPVNQTVSDYGSGAPGTILKQTNTVYYWQNYSNYLTANLLNLPQTVTTENGNGNPCAQTVFTYDNSSYLVSSGISTQHTSPPGPVRGNVSTITKELTTSTNPCVASPSWTPITTNYYVYDTGTVYYSLDPLNNKTTYQYSTTFAGAYPTQVTNALSQSLTNNYDFNTGARVSTTDPNQQTTSYSYDFMIRPTLINYPDGGQTSYCYTDVGGSTCSKASAPPYELVTTKQTGTSAGPYTDTVVYDGLGRVSETQLNTDPNCTSGGGDKIDTAYDADGRVHTVSNPYCTTTDPTYGLTTNAYDGLGRTTQVTAQDNGSVTTYSYSGNQVTVTDPAGNARTSVSDGLERLTQVTEAPGVSGYGFVTTYTYDVLSDLLTVVQNGSRNRSFAYDSLSRLTSATNPESGTITYSYDADSNLKSKTAPAPNQTGSSTVTTTYTYDALNRLTYKAYNDGMTPAAGFVYDQATSWGTITNGIGRLTTMTTSTAGTATATGAEFSYDPMGRTVLDAQCDPSNCGSGSYNPAYTYDLDGNMLTASNPVGYTISYSYNSAGRPAQVTSSLVDSNHPATLATADATIGYFPNGALRKMTLGNSLTEISAYNSRLQPCRLGVNTSGNYYTSTPSLCTSSVPSGNLLDFTYCYNGVTPATSCNGTSSTTTNNNNLTNWNATGQQTFTRSYSYDPLNRVESMSSINDPEGCSGYTWTIDAWGNNYNQSGTGGTCYSYQGAAPNAQNQLTAVGSTTYQYDAAGNMLYDGNHHYYYDAENRLIQVDGTLGTCSSPTTACYVYDADGIRVRTNEGTGGSEWIHDLEGHVVGQKIISLGWGRGYVYLGSQQIAEYGDGTTYFISPDHLGSTRLMTQLSQSVCESIDYSPFGQPLVSTNTCGTTHMFTGKEYDDESGLDYFGARHYSWQLGRFMRPDWAAKPIDVPYANFGDPQSLNLYSYMRGNPLNGTDPDGHCPICIEVATKLAAWVGVGVATEGKKEFAKDVGIGALKGAGAFVANTARAAVAIGEASSPGGAVSAVQTMTAPLPSALTPSNQTQAQVSTATQIGLSAASILVPGVSEASAASATTTVTHFTSDAGMEAITESGFLRAGTYVTTPGEIPTGATSGEVESLLEIGPGKGANSITFDTPNSNLTIPENGPTTSGGASQYQLQQPTPIDPTKFKSTPQSQ
jgi:RHS repeat-associated protein